MRVMKDQGFAPNQEYAAQTTQGNMQRGVRSRIDTKKLDLKSNCDTSTPYIVLRVSHN